MCWTLGAIYHNNHAPGAEGAFGMWSNPSEASARRISGIPCSETSRHFPDFRTLTGWLALVVPVTSGIRARVQPLEKSEMAIKVVCATQKLITICSIGFVFGLFTISLINESLVSLFCIFKVILTSCVSHLNHLNRLDLLIVTDNMNYTTGNDVFWPCQSNTASAACGRSHISHTDAKFNGITTK